ncbi:MAG: hypothetical protein K2X64_05375, partial [Rhodocyclaceae bacterium]|nr:hypothetical protein [Rhodocyclaceae bacterium]
RESLLHAASVEANSNSIPDYSRGAGHNGYGESLNDLWFHPAELYETIRPYVNPQDFVQEAPAFRKLHEGYMADMKLAGELHAVLDTPHAAAFELPDAPWARRISGILANQLAHAHPDRAHAVLTPTTHNTYIVSIRSPLNRPHGADSLCRQFPNGGGRAAAAGINGLAAPAVADLLDKLNLHFRPS